MRSKKKKMWRQLTSSEREHGELLEDIKAFMINVVLFGLCFMLSYFVSVCEIGDVNL